MAVLGFAAGTSGLCSAVDVADALRLNSLACARCSSVVVWCIFHFTVTFSDDNTRMQGMQTHVHCASPLCMERD